MKLQNQYDYLKIDCFEDVKPVEATSFWTVTDSRRETITITTAVLPEGLWVYGYTVCWAKGGTSAMQPTPENGKFHSQREAKLHAIGFMKIYLSYFLPETQDSILSAEKNVLQARLFD